MQHYDYVIIGGGICGVSAAERIRTQDTHGTIAVVSNEPHLLYSRVLLPSYLKKRIPRTQVLLRTSEDFTRQRIVCVQDSVLEVMPAAQQVMLMDQEALHYTKLLIASGGTPRPWGDARHARFQYRLQTLDDADRLFSALDSLYAPIIIGNSFIAMEFADIFVKNKIMPTILMRESYLLSPCVEREGGKFLEENAKKHGVRILSGDEVEKMSEQDDMLEITTAQGEILKTNCGAVGIGIARNMSFVRRSDIVVGERGIRVNEYLETNCEGIYAAGDVAEFYDVVRGSPHINGNWTNAVTQGYHAGMVMTGTRKPYRMVSAYSIENLGLRIAMVGDCDPQQESLVRYDEAAGRYARFFLKEGKLVGGLLINCREIYAPLIKYIEQGVRIDPATLDIFDASRIRVV
ncbi:MAG: FAD-dependent pyridine nucleotide-disulfide oxidoreductase [Parcubacteria group bacterium Gr01-1014_66]|nr:MAG: FAD-dependent pyridine nucleotide-disulfide oxidoreductase [Parcubacteria group bacterium Gr01-1014_66]